MTVPAGDPVELCVVPGWGMLHTRECPHLAADALGALVPATPEQATTLPVCLSCRAVVDGTRRRTFRSFDEALEAFQAPLENRPLMREIAAGLSFTEIWIPASGSYIAVAPARGITAVAYFNRGFVDVRTEDGGYRSVELPVNRLRDGNGSAAAARRMEDPGRGVCPTCFMQLPASGRCDACDD